MPTQDSKAHGVTTEWCRACLDEGDLPPAERKLTPAVGIVWGKLFPSEALGPRCLDHIAEQCDQYAAGEFYLPPERRCYAIYWLPPDREGGTPDGR